MHELPLLIFTLFLQGSVGVTLWLAFGEARASQSRLLLPAAGAFVLPVWGLSPRRCTWAIRSTPLTRCATFPAPG